MAEVLNETLDSSAVRARFSSLASGFAFLDAPGGSQVPDEVGDAIARALREASANMGAVYATSLRVKEIVEQAEPRAAAFLGCEPHEVIFGPNMTSLDFMLSRTAGPPVRTRRRDPGLLAGPRRRRRAVAGARARPGPGRAAHRTARRHDARPRGPGAQAVAAHARGRVRVGVERSRHDRRRGEGCDARALGRRAGLDRRRPLRRARADRRAGDRRGRPDLLAVQVLRAAPRHRIRARLAARVAGGPTRPGRPRPTRSVAGSRPARSPTSCSRASTRRSTTWNRSAASTRSCPTSARSASTSSPRSQKR